MSNSSFRKKPYTCGDAKNFHKEVNCIHWSIDTDGCKKTCALNLFDNPNSADCNKCKSRESYSKEILEEDEKKYVFTPLTIKDNTSIELIKSYVKAESSQFLHGKVSDEIYNERKNICLSCPQLSNNVNEKTDEVGWCKSCGCGIGSDRARLSVKLKMPSLNCPLGKFKHALGTGFTIESAVDSLGGAFSMVKKTITQKD